MTVSAVKNNRTLSTNLSTKMPVVRGSFITGILSEFRDDPLDLYLRIMHEHGDIAKVYYGPSATYHINHPDYISHILLTNNRNYRRSELGRKLLKMISGDNLLTSEGEYWLQQRRILQPAFLRKRIEGFSQVMTDNTAQMLERWKLLPAGQALDIDQEMMKLTFTIVGLALFSIDLSDEASEMGNLTTVSSQYFSYRLKNLLAPPLWFPTRRNREFKKTASSLEHLGPGLVAQRRREIVEHGTSDEVGRQYDMLDLLLEARYEDTGEGMNDQQLSSEIITMLGAGHETTANTLTWTFYLLSQHPDVEAKLYNEVDRVLNGRTPTMDDLKNLTYTRMVIDESMRLYPAAWAMSRQTIEPDQLGEHEIPAGSPMLISPYAVHRHPDFWDNPERCEPERFAPEKAKKMHRFAFFPFGGGPRQCIGQGFAQMESQLLLAMITQRFRLHLVPGHKVEPEPLITLRLKHGLAMTLEERR